MARSTAPTGERTIRNAITMPTKSQNARNAVQGPVGVECDRRGAEMKARRRNARQPVLATGIVRQRIELDEIEDFRDRHGDHRKVDAGAPECDQADQISDDGCHGRADCERKQHIGEVGDREQIGRNHAAGAEESRLAEGKQPREAEQNVEADAEQAPDHDPIDRRRCEPEVRQHKRRGDQSYGCQNLDDKGALPEHQRAELIRDRPCRAVRKAGTRAPTSWRRTA